MAKTFEEKLLDLLFDEVKDGLYKERTKHLEQSVEKMEDFAKSLEKEGHDYTKEDAKLFKRMMVATKRIYELVSE